MGRAVLAATLCASAALLPACGGDRGDAPGPGRTTTPVLAPSPAESRRLIADVVRTYFNALAAGDGQRLCAQMSSSAQVELLAAGPQGATCEEAVEQAVAEAGSPEHRRELLNTEVTDIEINGDSASARAVRGAREVRLVRNDGRWQVLTVERTGG